MSHRRAKRIRALTVGVDRKTMKSLIAYDKTLKGRERPVLPTLKEIHALRAKGKVFDVQG